MTARGRRGRPSSVFGAAALGLGTLAWVLAAASCRGDRLRDIESGDVDSVSSGGACGLPSGGRSGGRDAGVMCYLGESSAFGGSIEVSAVELSSGVLRKTRSWTIARDAGDVGAFARGLSHDGERFVAGSDASEGACLYLLDPATGEASCRRVAGGSARAQWNGTDWVAEYAEWGGLGRFPNLDAVVEGGPSIPLVRSTYHQFSVARGRVYALSSEGDTVEVFDLCTGELVRTLSFEAPATTFRGLSVTDEALYLLTERTPGPLSIVVFPHAGGAELGRVTVPGAPQGIFCSAADTLLGAEAGASPTWTPRAMCDAPAPQSPEVSEGEGPVTCFSIDSTGGASGRQVALVSVDLSTGASHELSWPSLPEEPSGPYPPRRALGFDGARFLLTAYDGAGSSWYLLGVDGAVSALSDSRGIAWVPWWTLPLGLPGPGRTGWRPIPASGTGETWRGSRPPRPSFSVPRS